MCGKPFLQRACGEVFQACEPSSRPGTEAALSTVDVATWQSPSQTVLPRALARPPLCRQLSRAFF